MADDRASDELTSREPTVEDLRELCRALNDHGAKYVIVGGFAIRAAGYIRSTMDVDVIVAADHENQARVFAALATLPDHAASELQPGELQQYDVIRVADEILVDVMREEGAGDLSLWYFDCAEVPCFGGASKPSPIQTSHSMFRVCAYVECNALEARPGSRLSRHSPN